MLASLFGRGKGMVRTESSTLPDEDQINPVSDAHIDRRARRAADLEQMSEDGVEPSARFPHPMYFQPYGSQSAA